MDNFIIFQSIAVFSSEMKSMGYEDNFQKNFIKLMEIYDGWKSPRKFFVFRKTSIHDKIFISAYSPFLDEAKDTIFILVACPGETWQPKKCLWLTGFSKVPNTVRSYVTLFLVFLGFSLLFIPYNTYSGLLYYLLFTYYHGECVIDCDALTITMFWCLIITSVMATVIATNE